MWRDMARQAAKYGLPPLTRPVDFPQNGLLAARIALLGQTAGWCAAFSRAVFHAQFAQGRSIADEEVLADILTRLDLDTPAILTQANTDQKIKDHLRAATERAQELGMFGAPSFVTAQRDLFWGNDRLEDALAAA